VLAEVHAFGVLAATAALGWFARATGASLAAVAGIVACGLAGATLAFFAPAAYGAATIAVVVSAALLSD
jgi:hypothetical protein